MKQNPILDKIEQEQIKNPGEFNVGDTVTVKCSEIDKQGRVNLTRIGLEDHPIIKAGEQ